MEKNTNQNDEVTTYYYYYYYYFVSIDLLDGTKYDFHKNTTDRLFSEKRVEISKVQFHQQDDIIVFQTNRYIDNVRRAVGFPNHKQDLDALLQEDGCPIKIENKIFFD